MKVNENCNLNIKLRPTVHITDYFNKFKSLSTFNKISVEYRELQSVCHTGNAMLRNIVLHTAAKMSTYQKAEETGQLKYACLQADSYKLLIIFPTV
jgi:hypothetical protein